MVFEMCYRRIEDALTHGTSLACAYPRVREDFIGTLDRPARE